MWLMTDWTTGFRLPAEAVFFIRRHVQTDPGSHQSSFPFCDSAGILESKTANPEPNMKESQPLTYEGTLYD
jgi:hypothetical protein